MRHKSLFSTFLAIAMVAALATTALASKPANPPGKPTTTTTTLPDYWTCQARIDNGAIWSLGPDGIYDSEVAVDLPLCVDIIEDHRDINDWAVDWSGTTARGTVKGLKFVFEEEVHGTIYAETVVYLESGTWDASWPINTVAENLVFVAMPHSGDKWIGPMTFKITPTR